MSAVEELAKQVLRSMEGLHIRMEAILSEMPEAECREWAARFKIEAESLVRSVETIQSGEIHRRRATDVPADTQEPATAPDADSTENGGTEGTGA